MCVTSNIDNSVLKQFFASILVTDLKFATRVCFNKFT